MFEFGNVAAEKPWLVEQERALLWQLQTSLGKVGNKVTVHVLGGDLQVEVGKTVFLSGAAEKVYEGTLFKEA